MMRDLRDHPWQTNPGLCGIIAAGLGIAGTAATAAGTVGSIAALGGGLLASSGAKSAAKTQAQAAEDASAQQTALGQQALQYQEGVDTRTYGDEAPYRALGTSALPAYQNILGLGTGGTAGEEAALAQTPGYQFALTQGVQSVDRELGSKGLSGAQAKGISRYVTGLADNTYAQQAGLLNQAVQTGQGAVATGGGIGSNTAGQVGSTTSNIGNAISSGILGSANANSAATTATSNALSGSLNGISNSLLYSKILGQSTTPGLYGGYSPTDSEVPYA